MPVSDLVVAGGPEAQIAAFVAGCQNVWANVRHIVVTRLKRPKGVVAQGKIVHLELGDGLVKDTAREDVERFIAAAMADVEVHGGGDYLFVAMGPAELPAAKPGRGRGRTIPSDQEIELHQAKIRLGEEREADQADPGAVARGAADIVRANAGTIGEIATGFARQAEGYEKLLALQSQQLQASTAMLVNMQAQEHEQWEGRVALKRIEYEIGRAERREELEDRREKEQREHEQWVARQEIAILEREQAMKERFFEFAKGALGEFAMPFVVKFAQDFMSRRGAPAGSATQAGEPHTESSGSGSGPSPGPSSVPKAVARIPEKLAKCLEKVPKEQIEEVSAAMGVNERGASIWELLVGASKAEDDATANAVLRNIFPARNSELFQKFKEGLTQAGGILGPEWVIELRDVLLTTCLFD